MTGLSNEIQRGEKRGEGGSESQCITDIYIAYTDPVSAFETTA